MEKTLIFETLSRKNKTLIFKNRSLDPRRKSNYGPQKALRNNINCQSLNYIARQNEDLIWKSLKLKYERSKEPKESQGLLNGV